MLKMPIILVIKNSQVSVCIIIRKINCHVTFFYMSHREVNLNHVGEINFHMKPHSNR